jgi:hypothetical protein
LCACHCRDGPPPLERACNSHLSSSDRSLLAVRQQEPMIVIAAAGGYGIGSNSDALRTIVC